MPPATASFDVAETIVLSVERFDDYSFRLVFNREITDISGALPYVFQATDAGDFDAWINGAELQIDEGDFHKLNVIFEVQFYPGGSWRVLDAPGVIFGAFPPMAVPATGLID